MKSKLTYHLLKNWLLIEAAFFQHFIKKKNFQNIAVFVIRNVFQLYVQSHTLFMDLF